ncbi:MAG: hypothetical protein FJW35_02730, partial [Acidobacteria bacterium]|nr:hypothetical protein [Acidobacteriota bacterium]
MDLEKRRPGEGPSELIFRSCYAPADLADLLQTPDWKLRVRGLAPAQLFFGLQRLDDQELQVVLPYLSGEQWAGVLDMSLWRRDRVSVRRFLRWQERLLKAEPVVARRLLAASDQELLELAFARYLKIFECTSEDEFAGEPEPGEERLRTPDGGYLIVLPRSGRLASIMRSLVLKLYELDANWARLILASCQTRTPTELEETAYQARTRRNEDLGFQEYFEAREVYAPLSPSDRLPEKKWGDLEALTTLPVPVRAGTAGPWLWMQALSRVTDTAELRRILEELFFVCNKVLTADSASPADTRRVMRGIRKTISGINLGLDAWSGGEPGRAVTGMRRHYLQSFFQIGYGRLLRLQHEARRIRASEPGEPGSLREAVLEGLLRRYPLLTVQVRGRIRRRH